MFRLSFAQWNIGYSHAKLLEGKGSKKICEKAVMCLEVVTNPGFFVIPKRREGGLGGVCGKNFFFGKTRFKSYLTINQSQKLKLIFFHIFLTASGEGGGGGGGGGGVNPSGQPDRFFTVFFFDRFP